MNKRNPKVSVLIPCYNSEKYISDTLESVLNQTWENLEIIVVDDNSQDGSFNIIREYANKYNQIKAYKIDKSGACAARNTAFELATGDFIQYLDADDLLSREKIEQQVKLLEKHPGCICTCSWGKFESEVPNDASIRWNDCRNRIEMTKPLEWLLSDIQCALHSWLIPKEIIERSGDWNPILKKNQDGEFMMRIIANSTGIICSDIGKAYYRTNVANSITSGIDKEKINSSYLGCKSFENVMLNFEDSKDVRNAIANRYLKFCYLYGLIEKDSFRSACVKYKLYGPGDYLPFSSKWLNEIGRVIGFEILFITRDLIKGIIKCVK